jgi:hypothetical protein
MSLTIERANEVLSYDPTTGVFVWKVDRLAGGKGQIIKARAGDVAGHHTAGYRTISIDCRKHKAHRLAWFMTYGQWPAEHIDHINGDPSDNRIANLREATRFENMRNSKRKSRNKSGIKGVAWVPKRGKWGAWIRYEGKNKYLGYYATAEHAHNAYALAAYMFHGEYARTE